MVGTMVRIAVTNTAATWLPVKVEVTMPMPVVAVTYSTVHSARVTKLPLIGTRKITSPSTVRIAKFATPMTM